MCVCVWGGGGGGGRGLEFSEMGGYPKWGDVFDKGGLNPSTNYVDQPVLESYFQPKLKLRYQSISADDLL